MSPGRPRGWVYAVATALGVLVAGTGAAWAQQPSAPAGAADPASLPEWTRVAAWAQAGPQGPTYAEGNAPDVIVANRIAQRLSWDRELARYYFDVRVEQGIATLTGQVGAQALSHRARRIAEGSLGVTGVVNAVRTAPKLQIQGVRELPPVDDETLRQRVMQSLEDHPEIQSDAIAVDVDDGRVILDGAISGIDERQRAEQIVLSLHGVEFVENRMTATEELGTGR